MDHPSTLNVQERVLVSLAPYIKASDNFVAPKEVTQQGIGEALGISRAHVAIELKKLMKRGFVEEKLKHVDGSPRHLLVYFPTPAGLEHVRRIKESVNGPLESLVFAPCTKIVRRRDTLEEIDKMRHRLDELEARFRADEGDA